jgi:hypothetical protein
MSYPEIIFYLGFAASILTDLWFAKIVICKAFLFVRSKVL